MAQDIEDHGGVSGPPGYRRDRNRGGTFVLENIGGLFRNEQNTDVEDERKTLQSWRKRIIWNCQALKWEIENNGTDGLERASFKGGIEPVCSGSDASGREQMGLRICPRVYVEIKTHPYSLWFPQRIEDIDKIRGLGLGADDYITKPFVKEMVARVI